MPRYLDIDSCLQAARLTAAAGEMAPFPFVKGAAQCVVVVLEIIQVSRHFLFVDLFPDEPCRELRTIETICKSWLGAS